MLCSRLSRDSLSSALDMVTERARRFEWLAYLSLALLGVAVLGQSVFGRTSVASAHNQQTPTEESAGCLTRLHQIACFVLLLCLVMIHVDVDPFHLSWDDFQLVWNRVRLCLGV